VVIIFHNYFTKQHPNRMDKKLNLTLALDKLADLPKEPEEALNPIADGVG
tara:strand:- start:499 stop:648 length:150 start_codon:yes stop_codon:yes gene_type:complete